MNRQQGSDNAVWFLVDRHVEQGRAERPAIFFRDDVYSYADLCNEINRFGNSLLANGIGMEKRVFLLSPDVPELAFSILGAMKIGAVPVAANTMLPPKDLTYILNDSRATLAVIHESLLDTIRGISGELRYLEKLIVIGRAEGEISYSDFVAGASGELAAADVCGDDAAVWQYSSGTTGEPKGIIQMHHNIVRHGLILAETIWLADENDKVYSLAKLFFGYGQGNNLYIPFSVGASVVLVPERPTPELVAKMITSYKPTVFCGVPTSFNDILKLVDKNPQWDFSSIKFCTSAGEALPAEVASAWKKAFGLEIIDGLGSTECFHVFISNRRGAVVAGSIGKPVDGFEIRLLDAENAEVADGEVGDLYVKGPSTAAGYWNKHEKTQATFQGAWVKTGDKASRDADGNFWFSGRSDDMIKAGGIWVSPLEVEGAILEHPAVFECCVVGAQDDDGLMKPKAFVVLNDNFTGADELTKEIQQFVKSKIAPYKYPRWIEYMTELPKTATGKLQRYRLR